MTDQTPRLGLPFLVASQAQKEVTHNQALSLLDALAHVNVRDRDLAAAPASPAEGDVYLVAAGAGGVWAGQSGNLAVFQAGAWVFVAPPAGMAMWVADEARLFLRDAGTWREVALVANLPQTVATTRDPDATDDGYPLGQLWYNSARDLMWVCRGNAAGAARWTYLNPVEVLGRQHTGATKTDADTAEATLYSLAIPADALGPNDLLRVTAVWSYPNSATSKTMRIRVGGTLVFSGSATTTASLSAQAQVANRDALNAQVGKPTALSSFGTNAAAPFTGTLDFAQAQPVTVTAQWGTAGTGSNGIILQSVLVELLRG